MEHIYNNPNFGENWFTYPNLYSRFVRELPSGSKIVEVGCWKGKSIAYLAVEIVNSKKDIKVDGVDTWTGSLDEEYHQNDTYVKTKTLYQLFLSNISSVSHIVNPVRMASVDAAKQYDDNSLDVVFIDAGHSYEDVKADIAAWMPKVKHGGYLSGHDYPWSANDSVKRAVDESVSGIEVTEGCWVYRKP
jgi:cephalosporin hydroxylase